MKGTLAMMSIGMLYSMTAIGQSDKADDVSRWKTFTNRAGWSIKHPRNWKVSSCHSCLDPTDPDVFVSFTNPQTKGSIMIDRLIDKPADQTIEQWLNDVSVTTNLNPRVSEEWVILSGARALKVINRNQDSTESENFYMVNGSKTFAIRTDRDRRPCQLCQRMLSTFKFTN